MRIFITGASGFIGSAVTNELLSSGHEVIGLARSDESATAITKAGASVLRGSLEDTECLKKGAREADGVIHLAFVHDSTNMENAVRIDAQAVEAFGSVLEGTDKPLLIASGTPPIPGRKATEHDPSPAKGPAAGRGITAQSVVDMSKRGIRSSVVRMPRSVHGEGDIHGLIPQIIKMARAKGFCPYVGDGSNRWPAVHILDVAQLARLAIEEAPAGSVLHAVGDDGVPVHDFVDVIGKRLNVPVKSSTPEELGFLGMILSIDQPASSKITQELLHWKPTHVGLIGDLDQGHYFNN